MLVGYMNSMLNSWGVGSTDASFKGKISQHQRRHLDLTLAYQKLCQDLFSEMLTCTMKGDLTEMQKTHKLFLEGLNKTLESMFDNNLELASQAPEKLAKVLNFQRQACEKLLDSFPHTQQIKKQIDKHYLTKGLKKLALGTATAVVAAVAIPTTGLTSDLFLQDQVQQHFVSHPQNRQDQINQMLDTPLLETTQRFSQPAKDLTPQGPDIRTNDLRYQGRSAIYGSSYPKMVMVHTPHHAFVLTLFSAALPYARAPQLLENYLAQHFSDYEKVYSFVVTTMPIDTGVPALKPHYFTHPDAPTFFAGKDYHSQVRWTVIPGAEGQIEPKAGKLQDVGFLSDEIWTHNSNPSVPNAPMGVSPGHVMHLNGFNKVILDYLGDDVPNYDLPTKDLYSLVTFTDEATKEKVVAITYHWLLHSLLDSDKSPAMIIQNPVEKSATMRQLIGNLENVDGFEDLTGELKRYVGLSPDSPVETVTQYLGQHVPYGLQGFADPEGTHRWTTENNATITIPVRDGDRQLKSILFKNTHALITQAHSQNVSVFLNNTKVADYQYNTSSPLHEIEIPVPANLKSDAVISFSLPNAVSPKDLGLNEDTRQLGIQLGKIDLSYRKNPIDITTHDLGRTVPYDMQGFSGLEGSHIWAEGNNASIKVPVLQGTQRVKSVTFHKTSAFVSDIHPTQKLKVFLNGQQINEYEYQYHYDNVDNWFNHTIMVPIPSSFTGDAVISFEMPDARSPKDLGLSEDARQLGISFTAMDVALVKQ